MYPWYPNYTDYYDQDRRYADARMAIAPPDLIEEPATENSAAVIEFEPQIPHNNTTGERHEKLIEE